MPKKSEDARNLKAFDKACDDSAKRHEALQRLEGEEAALTLRILKDLAHDIWGSADLHFDGDCFGEFEWCVIMRGGGMDQNRSFAEGQTALEAVLAGLTVKIRGCARGPFKTHLKKLQKHYGQVAQQLAERRQALG